MLPDSTKALAEKDNSSDAGGYSAAEKEPFDEGLPLEAAQ